jgi:hypothetical protein
MRKKIVAVYWIIQNDRRHRPVLDGQPTSPEQSRILKAIFAGISDIVQNAFTFAQGC